MPSIRDFFLGIVLPGILTGLVLAFAWARREPAASRDPRLAPFNGALAIAVGYVCCTLAFLGSIAIPSSQRTLAARDWLAWIAVACVVVYAVPSIARRRLARTVADVALALLLVWLCKGPTLGKSGGSAVLAAIAGLAIVAVLSAQSLSLRARGPLVPLALFCVACATSVASLLASSGLLALLAGGLTACFAACAVVGWWNRAFTLHGGAAASGVLLLSGLWINGVLFSRMPQSAGMLLWCASLAPWIAVRRGGETSSWKRIAWAVVLALVPSIAAVLIAKSAAPEPYY